jgi:hypothetical protein
MNARYRVVGLVVVVWSVGCGGTTIAGNPNDDDAGDSSAPDGGMNDSDISEVGYPDSSHPLLPGCPASAPTAGSACSVESLQCEYGNAWWSVACDVVEQCTNGEWQTTQLSFDPCSPEPGPNPASCPATSGDVPQGSSCSPANTNCYYPDAFCQCAVPLGGPIQIDGGSAYWTCLPGTGCPYPRPPLGSACVTNENVCNYEDCSYGQMCVNGAWQGEEEGCAGTAQ